MQRHNIDSGCDLGLIVRAAELCNPFLDTVGEITLELHGTVASSVLRWNESLFSPRIRPAMSAVVREHSLGGHLEIAAIDCCLGSRLPEGLAASSRTEGKRLIAGLLPTRGDRVLERYRAAVLAGHAPGNLAVVHALRSSLFSLPPRMMVGAYLIQEGFGAGLDGHDITRFLINPVVGRQIPSPAAIAVV